MIGRTLSHYKVLEEISRGGMGIVYKALDLKLNREVALKVLPPELVSDPDRKRRFVQEAQAAAALKHPNIAVVYEIDEVEDVNFIVMELIEGSTLSDMLRDGPLPVERAIEIAVDVTSGLASAHEKGIVHRDLKPGNIMVTRDGHPKIIDFGLAKLIEAVSDTPAEGVTAVRGETHPGTVLGTFAYMSPEQARGGSVDARSDVFSFGIVFFQMLSGDLPFKGETSADTLGAILKDPTPRANIAKGGGSLQPILNKCLAKTPGERYPNARELFDDLKQARTKLATTTASKALVAFMVATLAIVGAILFVSFTSRDDFTGTSFRFANPVQVTTALGVEEEPSWSPDASMLAFTAAKPGVQSVISMTGVQDTDTDIWITQVPGGVPINRTQDHSGTDRFPAWSPDGTQIAFWSSRDGGGYYIMPALAGPARLVRSTQARFGGGVAWSADGSKLACVVYDGELHIFAEVIDLESDTSERILLPGQRDRRYYLSWSPDALFFAYVDGGALNDDVNQLVTLRIADGTTHSITDGSGASWRPTWSREGRVVYYVASQGGATMDLWRQPLDDDGAPVGAPTALTTGIGMRRSAVFSPAHDRLAYSQGRLVANLWRIPILKDRPATWADAEQLTFENAHLQFFELSPDESRIALSSNRSGNFDLWIMPSMGGELTPLTNNSAHDWAPAWSPNAEEIAFYSFRTGDREIWVMPVGGGPARQLTREGGRNQFPTWSADGRNIVFTSARSGNREVWIVEAEGGEPPRQLTDGNLILVWPRTSPDGRLIAFVARGDDTNASVWVLPYDGGEPTLVTNQPARYPHWSRDGRILYFLDGGNPRIWSVPIGGGAERVVAELGGKPGALGVYGLDVGREHIYFLWDEDIGDIWMMDVVTE